MRHIAKKEIILQLQQAYGDQAPCKATLYNCCREFSSGRTSVFDSKRTERPVEIGDEKIENLTKIVKEERKMTQIEISQCLNAIGH